MTAPILITLTLLFIIINLYYFFTNKSFKKSYFEPSLLIKLAVILTVLTFGFAVLYYVLSIEEPILKINDPTDDFIDVSFSDALYFSGVTMLSIGYGDLVPIGAARFFSIIQAALGLLLPAAYFMKALTSGQNTRNKNES